MRFFIKVKIIYTSLNICAILLAASMPTAYATELTNKPADTLLKQTTPKKKRKKKKSKKKKKQSKKFITKKNLPLLLPIFIILTFIAYSNLKTKGSPIYSNPPQLHLSYQQKENKTGAPHDHPKTLKELIENIVHSLYVDPRKFPNTDQRYDCINLLQQSFFYHYKSDKEDRFRAYESFLDIMKKVHPDIKKQKEILVEEALKADHKQYDLNLNEFEKIWKQQIPIPENFEEMVYQVKKQGEGYHFAGKYTGIDKKKGVSCMNVCANKDIMGGFRHSALALEEWILTQVIVAAIRAEVIKHLAMQKAVSEGKKPSEGRKKCLIMDRVFIVENAKLFARMNLYGSSKYQNSDLKDVTEKITKEPKDVYLNLVFAAAPDGDRLHGDGAAKSSGKYSLAQVKHYFRQCYIATFAQQEYFLNEKKEKLLYLQEAHFGAGAFSHDNRMPYLAQPFAYYLVMHLCNLTKEQLRAVFYPYSKKGMQGLEDAKELWKKVISKAQENGKKTISPEECCNLWLEEAKKINQPLSFKQGDGN